MNETSNPSNHPDALERRLIAEAEDWRRAMPGRMKLVNPAESDASGQDTADAPLPFHRPSRLPWALAAAVLLSVGLFMIVNRPSQTDTPIDTSAVSEIGRTLIAGVEGLEDPLRREARGLADDTRAAATFLFAQIPGGQRE